MIEMVNRSVVARATGQKGDGQRGGDAQRWEMYSIRGDKASLCFDYGEGDCVAEGIYQSHPLKLWISM